MWIVLWDQFLMKKLLKNGICGSVNSAWIYCLPWKSQQMWVEKKKKKKNVENVNAVSAESKLHHK